MSFFNQYSFVVSAIVVIALLGFGLLRWQSGALWLRGGILGLVIVAAIIAHFSLRYPGATVKTVQDGDTLLNNGRPTFLMFYSNY